MSSQRIAHAHDAFVRTIMSDSRIAREFFTVHLPHAKGSKEVNDHVNLM